MSRLIESRKPIFLLALRQVLGCFGVHRIERDPVESPCRQPLAMQVRVQAGRRKGALAAPRRRRPLGCVHVPNRATLSWLTPPTGRDARRRLALTRALPRTNHLCKESVR